MTTAACTQAGAELVRRFQTRDPFAIAEGLGIHIYEADFNRLKGMYRVIQKRRCIFLNRKLDEQTARIVCAHEIGHDRLHRALAQDGGLLEVMLYDMTARPEYEANLVAAAILLPDEEVLRYVYEDGYSVEQIARAMATDVNLVAIKAAALKEAGHPIELPDHNTRFLQ